jgi:hypothetical protein
MKTNPECNEDVEHDVEDPWTLPSTTMTPGHEEGPLDARRATPSMTTNPGRKEGPLDVRRARLRTSRCDKADDDKTRCNKDNDHPWKRGYQGGGPLDMWRLTMTTYGHDDDDEEGQGS